MVNEWLTGCERGNAAMINARSLQRFKPLGDRLLRPIYDDYS
jgi:hypothetical protein